MDTKAKQQEIQTEINNLKIQSAKFEKWGMNVLKGLGIFLVQLTIRFSFAMSVLNQILGRVFEFSAFVSKIVTKIVDCFLCWTLIDDFSFDHQKQSIESVVNVGSRLMNGHDDCFSLIDC